MANYDYVRLEELKDAMHNTAILDGITITSTRGKSCRVKLETWCYKNGEEHAVIIIDGKNCHRTIVDNDNDGGITLGHFVFEILLAMNCRMLVNGRYRELNINSDMWYVNNPDSNLFGKLVNVTNGKIIC